MRVRCVTAVASLGFVAAACGGGPAALPTTSAPIGGTTVATTTTAAAPQASAAAELAAARARWSAAAATTHNYVFEDDCGECEQPVPRPAAIWDGQWVADSKAPLIEEIFTTIEAAIDAGRDVDVVYDESFGVPIDVWIDREDRAFDGGTHWLIREFAPTLPGDAASLETLSAARLRWEAHRPTRYGFTTRIICECELSGWMYTQVEGNRITEFEADLEAKADISPITIDQMMDDIAELLTFGVEEAGVRITGSADFHPDLGYPVWVGLDIEVDDPDGELAHLPPRLVFVVSNFDEIAPDTDVELGREGMDLDTARARWASTGPTDYTYELTVHDIGNAEFGEPYTVIVADGLVTGVTRGDEPVDRDSVPAHTIDDLFDLIALWRQSGAEVETLYHADTGHPVVVVRRVPDPFVISIDDLADR